MQFIIGSVCISLSMLIFCIVLLGARNPRQPRWASARWVGNCHSIIILLLGVIGLFSLFSAIFKHTMSGAGDLISILISAAILAVTILGVKALKIKKKIAEFEAGGTPGKGSKQNSGIVAPTTPLFEGVVSQARP